MVEATVYCSIFLKEKTHAFVQELTRNPDIPAELTEEVEKAIIGAIDKYDRDNIVSLKLSGASKYDIQKAQQKL